MIMPTARSFAQICHVDVNETTKKRLSENESAPHSATQFWQAEKQPHAIRTARDSALGIIEKNICQLHKQRVHRAICTAS